MGRTLDVIAVSESAKLLLSGRVPDVVVDLSSAGVKRERVHLHSQSGWRTKGGHTRRRSEVTRCIAAINNLEI